jgi:membrane protein
MARLSDVPRVFAAIGVFTFAKRVYQQLVDDNLLTWASALAYSWLFAVFPFMLFVLSLIPYLPEGAKAKARTEIEELVYQLPKEAAATVWTNVAPKLDQQLERPKGWLTFVGLGVALWAASGGMAMTMAALDKCYELERGRPFYQQRPLAVLLTVGVAVLMLAVVVLLPVGTAVKNWFIGRGYVTDSNLVWITLFDIVRWVLALFFMVSALTLVYHVGPSVKHRFHWLTPGAVFCVVVWVVLGLAFRLYVEKYGKYEQTYGTVGGVAVLLLFFYVDSLVLLIGAEINSEIDFEVLKVKRGTRDFRPAEIVAEAAADELPLTEAVPAEVTEEARKAAEAADQAADEEEAERIEKDAREEEKKATEN